MRHIDLCLQSVKVVILPMLTVFRIVAKCLCIDLKFFFWQSPTDYSEGDLPKETRTKVRYSLYGRVITGKARKIMNSYETNDSAFFYFFLFVFQESLVEAEIGRQKPSSDEEHQKIDSGARYSTKEFRLILFKMKNF